MSDRSLRRPDSPVSERRRSPDNTVRSGEAGTFRKLQQTAGNRATARLAVTGLVSRAPSEGRSNPALMEPVVETGKGRTSAKESPLQGAGKNPTYDEARLAAHEYTDRQLKIHDALVEVKGDAYEHFGITTRQLPKGGSRGLVALLEFALETIPVAKSFVKALDVAKGLKDGVIKLLDAVPREALKAAAKGTKYGRARRSGSARAEAVRKAAFEHTVISDLTALRAAGLERWLTLQDLFRSRLSALRSTHESINLKSSAMDYLTRHFGDMPPGSGLSAVVKEAALKFEGLLYREFYKPKIRYYVHIRQDPYRASIRVDGLPKRVKQRLLTITGESDITAVLHSWGMRPGSRREESRAEQRRRRRSPSRLPWK